MYHDAYRPGDFANMFARRVAEFVSQISAGISFRGRQQISTRDALSERLAQVEREIDSIRHDVGLHRLQNSAKRKGG